MQEASISPIVLVVWGVLNCKIFTITLRRVRAISKGLHTVTEITPATRPDKKFLNLSFSLSYNDFQCILIYFIKLMESFISNGEKEEQKGLYNTNVPSN